MSSEALDVTPCAGAIAELMRREPERVWTRAELVVALGEEFTDTQVRNAVGALEKSGVLCQNVSKGKHPTLYAYRLAFEAAFPLGDSSGNDAL